MKPEAAYDPLLPPGSGACQCSVCRAYFTSVTAFDNHRVGKLPDRRCLTPAEMRAPKLQMKQNARGQWTSDKLFAWADEQDAPARKEG